MYEMYEMYEKDEIPYKNDEKRVVRSIICHCGVTLSMAPVTLSMAELHAQRPTQKFLESS